ncbi:hypothetical protein TeGR_g7712 [Tetraparma gracilis]|uniref:Immediate early response 3-interacting protein 1 n=1 Tax=Tetraparma gracilis TaxID=2962635 RepID=A0ABQ6MV17_9STRA|nr:hypothetical protein TeGR_g7712 [Tetraparma gracilis]
MGFSLFNLFKAGLLLTNAVLVLHRARFLSKFGLASPDAIGLPPLKAQAAGLLNAVEYLRVPVVACNGVTILFELLLGGT